VQDGVSAVMGSKVCVLCPRADRPHRGGRCGRAGVRMAVVVAVPFPFGVVVMMEGADVVLACSL